MPSSFLIWMVLGVLAMACRGAQVGATTTQTTGPPEPTTTAKPMATTTVTSRPTVTVDAPERLAVTTDFGVAVAEASSGELLVDLAAELSGRAVGYGAVAVSEDGTTVYLTATIGAHRSEIHRVPVGGSPELVAAGSSPALSPDGAQLAYAVPVPLAEGQAQALREHLVIRDLASGEERVWENAAPGDPGLPADLGLLSWAPDSRHLVFEVRFEDGTQVRILDSSQGGSVLDSRPLEPPQGSAFFLPTYRGDRGTLVVVQGRGGVDPAIDPQAFSIVELDAETGELLGSLVEPDRAVADTHFDRTGDHMLFITTHLDHDEEGVQPNEVFRWEGDQPIPIPVEREPLFAAW